MTTVMKIMAIRGDDEEVDNYDDDDDDNYCIYIVLAAMLELQIL
jgi:hypothetical protein